MSKRELIARELNQMLEPDLDKLLAFLRSLKQAHRACHTGAWR